MRPMSNGIGEFGAIPPSLAVGKPGLERVDDANLLVGPLFLVDARAFRSLFMVSLSLAVELHPDPKRAVGLPEG